ncbi:MAG: MerR family transcriptional regulator, partial [Chloroflexota bacterium]
VAHAAAPDCDGMTPGTLLRIGDVAELVGTTARTIRYYEEMGLLEPAARSEGDYRLYDDSDLERLQFIRSLRDDAGFSLAQIGQLLEDEHVRERNRERIHQTDDPDERRSLILDARGRVDHQVEILEAKAARLAAMIEEARGRRAHLDEHLAELDGGPDPHPGRER